jgi:hypothetical protein
VRIDAAGVGHDEDLGRLRGMGRGDTKRFKDTAAELVQAFRGESVHGI